MNSLDWLDWNDTARTANPIMFYRQYYGNISAMAGKWRLYVLGEDYSEEKTLFVCRHADTVAKFTLGECSWDEAKGKAKELFASMFKSIKKSVALLPSSSGLKVSGSFGQGCNYAICLNFSAYCETLIVMIVHVPVYNNGEGITTRLKVSKALDGAGFKQLAKNTILAIRRFERNGKSSAFTTLV